LGRIILTQVERKTPGCKKTKQRINICKAAYTEVSDDCATGKCTQQTMKKDKMQKRRKRFPLFFKKGLTKGKSGVIMYRSFKEAMLERRCGGIGRRPGLKIP
jgi:hypothetical protein